MPELGAATPPTVRLGPIATAVPAYALDQAAVRTRARTLFAGAGVDVERLLPAFENAGIRRRYSCVPLDSYGRSIGWKERNALYERHALELLAQAAGRVLDAAGLGPGDVDAAVTVSSTGLATPSLDARLLNRLGLRADLERLPVFGLGCCGGVLGLGRAAALAQAGGGRRVLLLAVELCALTFRPDDSSKSNLIATALFGDGACAALVSGRPEDAGARIAGWGEHTWPDSEDVMGWRVEDDGLGVLFSRDIPSLVRRDLAPALDAFLARHGLVRGDLAAAACHPGGAKVIAELEALLGAAPGAMAAARGVLADYGNMSAPTVLFVLQRLLADPPDGPVLATALGPGFSAGFALLQPDHRP
jgi:alkylresorcinol/alkylpyrone synthase